MYLTLTSNPTIQPQQNQKTSKSTTQKHPTSILTTRQTMTSKSLCHVQNHAFGLVSAKRYFHIFITSIFHSQTFESLCLQASYYTYLLTLVINTTVSTCNDPSGLMFYTVSTRFSLFSVFSVIGNMSMALLEVSVSGNKSTRAIFFFAYPIHSLQKLGKHPYQLIFF